jgi:hypothetical protein
MRTKAVLTVLSLLLFIFCSASLSQAAVDPRYSLLPPVNEHPWQHDGSPDPGDTSGPSPSPSVIWPMPVTVNSILFIRVPQRIAAPGLIAKDAAIMQRDKRRFEGK